MDDAAVAYITITIKKEDNHAIVTHGQRNVRMVKERDAWMDIFGAKLPVKYAVSKQTPRMTPGRPRWTMAQSCPLTRLRADSHPSIHLPLSVKRPSFHTGASGCGSGSESVWYRCYLGMCITLSLLLCSYRDHVGAGCKPLVGRKENLAAGLCRTHEMPSVDSIHMLALEDASSVRCVNAGTGCGGGGLVAMVLRY